MSKLLVVYYSRTGYTKSVAERLAARHGADIAAIAEARGRLGILGYLRSAREAFKKEPVEIQPLAHDPKHYDIVVFGTPVWAGHVSSPMRACLDRYGASPGRVAFFCTQGGSGADKVLEEMAGICGRRPDATLALRDSEIRQGDYDSKLDAFDSALAPPAAA